MGLGRVSLIWYWTWRKVSEDLVEFILYLQCGILEARRDCFISCIPDQPQTCRLSERKSVETGAVGSFIDVEITSFTGPTSIEAVPVHRR